MDTNRVTVPLFEFDKNGAMLPNYLFHRSYDYVHSRCIEYPFAAAQVKDAQRILDVGSVKADSVWINWLESLPYEVHATDYDADVEGVFQKSKFQQADVRQLPYPDNHFDLILAVSVIEHIGLASAQVNQAQMPSHEGEGDIAAVVELLRVLKPKGRLVMTFPYSYQASYDARRKTGRIYNEARLAKFNALAHAETLDYYEYQYVRKQEIFLHKKGQNKSSLRESIASRLKSFVQTEEKPVAEKRLKEYQGYLQGKVTWRRIPRSEGQASNHAGHIDGIICGVWRKEE